MEKTIVVIKEGGKKFVLSFEYVHMAIRDPKATFVYCPQTNTIYLSKPPKAEK